MCEKNRMILWRRLVVCAILVLLFAVHSKSDTRVNTATGETITTTTRALIFRTTTATTNWIGDSARRQGIDVSGDWRHAGSTTRWFIVRRRGCSVLPPGNPFAILKEYELNPAQHAAADSFVKSSLHSDLETRRKLFDRFSDLR